MTPAISRRAFIVGAGAALASSWIRPATAQAARPVAGVVVLGPAPPAQALKLGARALVAVYGFEVRSIERRTLPKRAFYRPGGRYRAEILVEELARDVPGWAHRVVGVTATDISTTKPPYADWGILGLSDIGGAACVASSYRCRRGTRTALHAAQRFGKVVVHEMGHALGLPHCTVTKGCLMEDAGGTVFTTDAERDLCTTCRLRLARLGFPLVGGGGGGGGGGGTLPW